ALRLLLVATYLAVVATGPINALSSGPARDVLTPVGYSALGCLAGLALLAPLGSWLGADGITLAYLVAMALASLGPIAVVWRRWGMGWGGAMLRCLLVVAVGYAVAAVPPAGARPALDVALAGGCLAFGLAVLAADGRALLAAARRPVREPR